MAKRFFWIVVALVTLLDWVYTILVAHVPQQQWRGVLWRGV